MTELDATGLDDVVSSVSSTDGFFFDRWFLLPMTLARRIMTAWLIVILGALTRIRLDVAVVVLEMKSCRDEETYVSCNDGDGRNDLILVPRCIDLI